MSTDSPRGVTGMLFGETVAVAFHAIHANMLRSVMQFNGGAGLTSTSSSGLQSGYRGNVFEVNTGGAVTGNPVEIGENLCNGNTTCP